MRTIRFTSSDQEKFDDFFAVNHAKTEAAIGYLSLWNLRDFPEVNIYWNGRHEEFTAHYTTPDSTRVYVIGGVWNADSKTFSFHS